jgi:hypothetical protein
MGEADFRLLRFFPNLTRGKFSSVLFRSGASRNLFHPRPRGGLPILIQWISAPVINPHGGLGPSFASFPGSREKNKAFRKTGPSPSWVFHRHPGQKIFGGENSEAV